MMDRSRCSCAADRFIPKPINLDCFETRDSFCGCWKTSALRASAFPVHTMTPSSRVALLLLALVSASAQDEAGGVAATAACSDACKGSCCYFSEPDVECSGCDESFAGRPGAECYDVDDPTREEKLKEAEEKTTQDLNGNLCKSYCNGAESDGCCFFSQPQHDCSGCSDEKGCNPKAKCYDTGRPKGEL